jgi:hypothetical protein
MITKYRNLTNAELLNRLDEARLHSPIIEELCARMEVKSRAICPVCEADLTKIKDEL